MNYQKGIELGILDPSIPEAKENILLLQKFFTNLRKCGIAYSIIAAEGYKYASILMETYLELTRRQVMDYASQLVFVALTQAPDYGMERVNHQVDILEVKNSIGE